MKNGGEKNKTGQTSAPFHMLLPLKIGFWGASLAAFKSASFGSVKSFYVASTDERAKERERGRGREKRREGGCYFYATTPPPPQPEKRPPFEVHRC